MSPLVLSLFPDIGLLDMAFEERGFCVVRGPDLLWGGDVRRFNPPAGKFEGIIGCPPCQAFSKLGVMARNRGQKVGVDMIPEFVRVVEEAEPTWFLMENVQEAPIPSVRLYEVWSRLIDNRLDADGIQRRVRRFSFGTSNGRALDLGWWRPPTPLELVPTVTANGSFWDPIKQQSRGDHTTKTLRHTNRAQGLDSEFLVSGPFTVRDAIKAVGNGVPLPMGKAVADAVWRAVYETSDEKQPAVSL